MFELLCAPEYGLDTFKRLFEVRGSRFAAVRVSFNDWQYCRTEALPLYALLQSEAWRDGYVSFHPWCFSSFKRG